MYVYRVCTRVCKPSHFRQVSGYGSEGIISFRDNQNVEMVFLIPDINRVKLDHFYWNQINQLTIPLRSLDSSKELRMSKVWRNLAEFVYDANKLKVYLCKRYIQKIKTVKLRNTWIPLDDTSFTL